VDRHPDHDAVRREVRRWYTESVPEIGLSVVAEHYGFLTGGSSKDRRRLLLTVESPDAVAPALDSAAEFFGSFDFEIWVDDRARVDRLAGALGAAGWEPGLATTTLALLGPVRAGPGPEGLALEDVSSVTQLEEWSATKIRGFADDEAPPTAEQVAGEVAGRRAEWPVCRYQLARLGGDPVAVLGHYTGSDQMVFSLATRVPFRHRGIARTLLARWSEEPGDTPVRSRLINCDDGGRPEALYRRLGFTDEVWWYRRYRRSR
jgi:GNAT superfamily N-acetyltransferase